MINDYIIKERLGVGSYGTVYKVKKKNTNKIFVIKQISLLGLSEQQKNEYKLEARILSSIKSNYVVKYYDSFEEKNNLNIVMEYCDGGDLFQFIEEKKKTKHLLNESLIWELFIKMILGLSSIHKKKILHRDLKSQNIFLTKKLEVKIGDLGVAKKLNQTNFAKTFIGTPFYLSPELCSEKPYNDKSDIWAIGCILYELCTYKHPFNAKSQGALILKILNHTPEKIHQYYSRDLQKMIDLLLNKNYLERPSCSEILKMPIVLLKAKKCDLFGEVLNENNNCKNQFYLDLDSSNNICNKERRSYDGEKVSKKYNIIQKLIIEDKFNENQTNLEINKNKKKTEYYNLYNNSNINNKIKNEKDNNNTSNSNSFIKYSSKYNNHFYYNSNNKKDSNKNKISNKDIVFSTKNKINQNKIIKKVITKIINQKNDTKKNYQIYKNKRGNKFMDILNNAINENNYKEINFNKKEKKYLKGKITNNEKPKTPSIKNIKKNESSFFNYNANNKEKNMIIGYNDKQVSDLQNQVYHKKACNTEEKFKFKNIENRKKGSENKINSKDNINENNKKNDTKINQKLKLIDVKEFAKDLNNYVNRYKNSEFNTLNKDYQNNKVNILNNPQKYTKKNLSVNKSANFAYQKMDNNKNKINEEENNRNMNNSTNKFFEINIGRDIEKNISNNNYINNNINININNINNSNNSTGNLNNSNNNNILNSIMNFKIINNNDSDIHININNNSPINSINSNKENKISINTNSTGANIMMNSTNEKNNLNNSNSENDNERGLYSEEENSEEENEIVKEIKENKNIIQNKNNINNLSNNDNINYGNISLNEIKNKLVKEKKYLIEKINIIKDDILSLIGGTDYNYIFNLYNNTDKENENIDEIYEKIEKFVNMNYDIKKKESFDNLYFLLISLDCQLFEKENKLKSINV